MKNFAIVLIFGILLVGCAAKKDSSESSKEQEAQLFKVVLKQDLSAIDRLIEKKVNLNVYDENGYTPLMRAVKSNHSLMAEKLIMGGAKVYQPLQTNKDVTAYSMINTNEKEMTRIFDKEAKRYGALVENFIGRQQYVKALKLTQNDFLPSNLIMPKSYRTALYLMAGKRYINVHALSYIQFLLENHSMSDKNYLKEHERVLHHLIEKTKNSEILNGVLTLYTKNKVDFPQLTISKKDRSDMAWMSTKLKALNHFDQNLPLTIFHRNIYIDTMKSLKSQTLHLHWDPALSLIKEITISNNSHSDKEKFLQEILVILLSRAKKNKVYLDFSLDALNIWRAHVSLRSIRPSLYSFDDHMLTILESAELTLQSIDSLEPSAFDLESFESKYLFFLKNLTESLYSFASRSENHAEKSVQFILSGDFTKNQRKELLSLILARTGALPKEILAYAIQVGGLPMVKFVTSLGVEWKPEEQQTAVASALFHVPSADMAYELLAFLQTKRFFFHTPSGVEALEMAFEKVWEGEGSYKKPLDLLLEAEPSPLNTMGGEKVYKLLQKHLQFVRKKQKDWSLMTQILNRWKETISGPRLLVRPIHEIPELPNTSMVEMSFVWDSILTMYEVYKKRPTQWYSISEFLSKVISQFPEDYFSMNFMGQSSSFKSDEFSKLPEFSFQEMMWSLSLIFSINEATIRQALAINEKEVKPHSVIVGYGFLSWKDFLEGPIYTHYSSKPEFWERVSHLLLTHISRPFSAAIAESPFTKILLPFKLSEDRSTADFIKIMAHSGQLQKHSVLSFILREPKLSMSEERCLFNKKTYDSSDVSYPKIVWSEGESRESIKNQIEGENLEKTLRPFAHEISRVQGYHPMWTSLGIFEILRPFKDRSCGGGKMEPKEMSFIENFIFKNLKVAPRPLENRPPNSGEYLGGRFWKKTVLCSDYYSSSPLSSSSPSSLSSSSSGTSSSHSQLYSPMGVFLEKSLEGVETHRGDKDNSSQPENLKEEEMCYLFAISDWIRYAAKQSFLNSWYKCAMEKDVDSLLVNYFNSVKDEFHLKSKSRGVDYRVHICRWKSL